MQYQIEVRIFRTLPQDEEYYAGRVITEPPEEVEVYKNQLGFEMMFPEDTVELRERVSYVAEDARDHLAEDMIVYQNHCQHLYEEGYCQNCGKEFEPRDEDGHPDK